VLNFSTFSASHCASGEEVILKGITYVSVSQNVAGKNHLKVTVKNRYMNQIPLGRSLGIFFSFSYFILF
jgi:hypothetical protein